MDKKAEVIGLIKVRKEIEAELGLFSKVNYAEATITVVFPQIDVNTRETWVKAETMTLAEATALLGKE